MDVADLVLVVDDDDDVRSVVVLALSMNGFEVIEARTVADGVAQLQDRAPAVVLTDMAFGPDSGEVVVAACREVGVPVVVMTASVSDDVLGPLAAAGVGVVRKPFSMGDMVEAVSAAIR